MMGATAGRTTLTGEGLQHDDGQSHIQASIVPNVLAYDPAFAYELAIIVREGIDRMYGERGEDVFYYITIYNENWAQPAKADGVEEGILRGLYRFREAPSGSRRVQLLASGPIVQQALRAQQILAEKYDVAADLWSATSFQQPRNDASTPSAGTASTPTPSSGCRTCASASGRRSAPSWPPPTISRRCRTWSRAGSIGRTPCSAPTASAAPTPRGASHALRGQRRAHRVRRAPRTLPRRQLDAG